jgi:arginyl-tRNA synthetase
MIEQLKNDIKVLLEERLHLENLVVEEPKKGNADLAIPLFAFAKTLKKSPMDVFKDFE